MLATPAEREAEEFAYQLFVDVSGRDGEDSGQVGPIDA